MDARSLRTEHVCGELQALNVTCVLIGSAPQSPAAAAAGAALWKKLAAEAAAAAAAELLPVGQTRHQHAVNCSAQDEKHIKHALLSHHHQDLTQRLSRGDMPEAAAAAAAAAAPLPAAVADAAAADCCSLRPVHKEKKHRPPEKNLKRVCT